MQQDAAAINAPLVHNLAVIGGQQAGHFHTFLALRPLQLPDPEGVVALLDHQAIVPGQFRQRARCAAPLQIGRCGAKHPTITRQRLGDEVRINFVADAHVKVKALVDQVDEAVLDVQANVQLRVARREFREGRGDKAPAQPQATGNTQLPAGLAVQGADVVAHPLHRVEDAQGPLVDPLAVVAHRNPTSGAVQQAHAEVLLEQANALADEGGGHAQLAGCAGKACAAGDMDEDVEVFQVR
ncbi:hypothetical protein D9M71_195740 [compost metagenome]